ncbi:MAG: nicotinate-nucleotide adenylyltransferase [Pseudomonadota bacterium]
MQYVLPPCRDGQAIGLLGGSFDPPHAGHVHISREALRRFGLDQVWWLVSPGNPLKARGPAPLERRMAACRALAQHPRLRVSDFESQAGTRYTAETLAELMAVRPRVSFVWLMGADNLAQFDHWQDWRRIIGSVPLGVLARPGQRISARMSKAARVFRAARLPARKASLLPHTAPPCWCFVNVPMSSLSSSDIRDQGDWTGLAP